MLADELDYVIGLAEQLSVGTGAAAGREGRRDRRGPHPAGGAGQRDACPAPLR